MIQLNWYQVSFPSGLEPDKVLAVMRGLSSRHRRGFFRQADPVVFEVHAQGGQLRWWLGLVGADQGLLHDAVETHLPGIRLTIDDSFKRPDMDHGVELKTDTPFRLQRTDIPLDAAAGLLKALECTGHGEALVVQWVIGPWLQRPTVPPAQAPVPHTIWNLPDWGKPVLDSEAVQQLRKKQQEAVLGVVGRVAVCAATAGRRKQLLRRVVGSLQLTRASGAGLSSRHLIPGSLVPGRLSRIARPTIAWPCVLSAAEMISVVGWPVGNPVLGSVSYRSGRLLPSPRRALIGIADPRFRITGRATYPGSSGLLQLSPDSALRHLHVLGPTGVGKSTLLGNLILQDIRAGRGVVVFDPKADLIAEVIDRVPREHVERIVLLDPADQQHPVGLNVLRGAAPELLVDGIVHLFHLLYASAWGPRTQDILYVSCLTLILTRPPAGGHWTIIELPVLLSDAGFRRQVVAQLPADDVSGMRSFWSWFEALSEPERATVIAPVMNKLRSFTLRPALQLMLGQEQGFSFAEVFTQRKVVLVSLARAGLGPETANLLGGLLLSSLWAQIQRRAQIPQARRHPVFVYLDEFQDYLGLPIDLADALAQARGLGVGITLAHQHIAGQLSPDIRAAVLGTVRSRIAFQLGHDDARTMATVMGGGLSPDDLSGLEAYETYQQLLVDDATPGPASAQTLPLPTSLHSAERVRAASRRAFGRPRAEVEAQIRARHQPGQEASGAVGSVVRRPRGGIS